MCQYSSNSLELVFWMMVHVLTGSLAIMTEVVCGLPQTLHCSKRATLRDGPARQLHGLPTSLDQPLQSSLIMPQQLPCTLLPVHHLYINMPFHILQSQLLSASKQNTVLINITFPIMQPNSLNMCFANIQQNISKHTHCFIIHPTNYSSSISDTLRKNEAQIDTCYIINVWQTVKTNHLPPSAVLTCPCCCPLLHSHNTDEIMGQEVTLTESR